ncbi:hypothetical protein [Natrinema pallidum]|nr:hypothetical protein [Natrinema pallidum]
MFGETRSHQEAENGVQVQIEVKNEGRAPAEDCTVKFSSTEIQNQTYHTRWSDVNEVETLITPGEEEMVDLFWMDLKDKDILTAKPEKEGDEKHYPPGEFGKIHRVELSVGDHSIISHINARNMAEIEQEIEELSDISVPDGIVDLSEEWEVIEAIKQVDETFVIFYNIGGEKVLEVSSEVDLEILDEIDELSREKINARPNEQYSEALKRIFTIERY